MEYFTSIFSGGFTLPYELGEKHADSWGNWEHFRAARSTDKKPVSVFRLTAPKTDTLVLEAARNGVKKLRVTKHPRVLTFEWTGETDSGSSTIIYLATEPVTPLTTLLKSLSTSLTDEQRLMYLALGLRQAAQAVAFLNNQCKMMHGNVCMRTMLVTEELDWKLGFFDMVSDHAHLTSSLLTRCGKFVPDHYKAAELARGDIEALSEGPPWCVDSWGLGCLMHEAFSGKELQAPEELRELSHIPKEISSEYQKLLSQNPVRRLNPNKLSDSEFLKNDLIDVVHTLENLSIREPLEKTKFFRNLPKQIPMFPPVICTGKLLPLVAAALEYGGAPAMALGCLLQIGKMLDDEAAFKASVVPIISSLFSSPDHSIRNTLISNINEYASFLSESVVESSIFPQLTKGLTEQNAYLREQTLKAMLPLAPKLSQRTLNGPLLKQLARLQVDEEPSIRANTTVLLGNIAALLGPAACKRILLNAFTRALKDIFPPSRIAALKALMATAPFHSPTDVACRVVPSISPMMLDSNRDVRVAAVKAMNFFLGVLTQAAEDIDNGIDPNKAAAKAASQEAKDISSNVSSFLGWAMSSISAATTTSSSPTGNQQKTAFSGGSASRQGSVTNGATPNGSSSAPRGSGAIPVSTKRDLDAEGWGDEDLDLFQGPPSASASATGRMAAPQIVDTSSLDKLTDDGWGDGEWGDIAAPKPTVSKPKVKPKLSKPRKSAGSKGD